MHFKDIDVYFRVSVLWSPRSGVMGFVWEDGVVEWGCLARPQCQCARNWKMFHGQEGRAFFTVTGTF